MSQSESGNSLWGVFGDTFGQLGNEFAQTGTQRLSDALVDALGGREAPEPPPAFQTTQEEAEPEPQQTDQWKLWGLVAIGVAVLAMLWR